MSITRRSFLHNASVALAAGSMARVISSRSTAQAQHGAVTGYGPLVADPAGLLDLPAGFSYRVFSREGDALTKGGLVPASHDGMGAFSASFYGSFLVRNHELNVDDVAEEGLTPVAHVDGHDYDPEAVGGTSTLLVSSQGRLISHKISLSGTLDNCAGGHSPWNTWLTCEETFETLGKKHGYIFEVDPWRGGNPAPITALGRFEHEAISFGRDGRAYLTEDAGEPHGCVYRFSPTRPLAGPGSLHAGGTLQAMAIEGVTSDLSSIADVGAVVPVRWVDVPNADPGDDETPTREQAIGKGATPIHKAEGTWRGVDGSIWLVSSYADGPDAEEAEDVTDALHKGQVWRYDPRAETMELVVQFPADTLYDGPDNLTVSPHGYALVCTDGEDDNWLLGITPGGAVFPFARNAATDDEFAGAVFSPDGRTLFVNIQGSPSFTLAIRGPFQASRRRG